MNVSASNVEDVLACRLLCASNAAYGIAFDNSNTFNKVSPYYDKIELQNEPSTFVAGTSGEHACLIGTMLDPTLDSKQDCVVLAFRGTHPPEIKNIPDAASFIHDWVGNFDASPIAVNGIPGEVHEGFWMAIESLWTEEFINEIKTRLAASSAERLYITGHSKGGAMAHLAALRLKLQEAIIPTAVYTYAGARAGTQGFADAYRGRSTGREAAA